jgi:hypothetical protein
VSGGIADLYVQPQSVPSQFIVSGGLMRIHCLNFTIPSLLVSGGAFSTNVDMPVTLFTWVRPRLPWATACHWCWLLTVSFDSLFLYRLAARSRAPAP